MSSGAPQRKRARYEVISLDDDPEVITLDDTIDEEEEMKPGTSQAGGSIALRDVAEIQWSQKRIKRNGRFTSVVVRDLTFPHLENIDEPLNIIMPRLFDQFLDHCLEASSVPNADRALFCLTISHPALEKAIFIDFRRRINFDGKAIVNLMGKTQQSYKEVLLGENLHMEMYVFDEAAPASEDQMSGGRRFAHYFDQDLQIPGTVPKTEDGYCLARALVIGMMIADEAACTDDDEKKRLNRKRRNYVARDQPGLHIQLLEKAGLPLGLPAYDLGALEAIAAQHPEYSFVLYTRPPGHKMYTISRMFNGKDGKVVNFGFHDNHYDIITPVLGINAFEAVICNLCSKFKKSKRHRCDGQCNKCHRKECAASTEYVDYIVCEGCNVKFASEDCFNAHKAKVCRNFKACKDCQKYHRVERTRPHVCDTKYCRTCKSVVEIEHQCCWVPPTDQKRAKMAKSQETYKIVFYDFETVVLEDGVDLSRYGEEQWPNLVAYSRFCDDCVTSEECGNCMTRKGHFIYQACDTKWSVTDRFLDWILSDPANSDTLFIAHNGSRFDMHFLISRLVTKGIYPKMILNGTQIIQMAIEPMKGQKFNAVTFKDSYLLVPLPLSALPKAFDIAEMSKGEFPYLFNHPINYGKRLATLPEKKYYCTDRKKSEALEAFNAWYESRRDEPFDFDAEILAYCQMDVDILAESMKKYMLLATSTTGWNPLVHCTTFGSFSMLQLKMNHLKPNQVGILPETGYHSGQRQSKIALQYIKWLEAKLGRPLRHKLNGGEMEVEVNRRKFLLDAFDQVENRAYEINGCVFHGCPMCTNPAAKAPREGSHTMEELYNKTMERQRLLESAGFNVTVIWEHQIRNEIRNSPELADFIKKTEVVTRLTPRDAFLGGRTQTFKLLAEASESHTLEYVDFCSLYPYVTAFDAEYPVGTPDVITDDFMSFESGCPYKGLIKCDVLPPSSIRFPVIGTRLNNKLIFTNCRSCAAKAKNVPCAHLDDPAKRAIHTTVTHVELACAIERGYKVLRVYEVWSWTEWNMGGLFKDFVKSYIKIKQEASGWPKANMTDEEKAVFLSDHEKFVGVKLDAANIKKNPAMRSIAKLQLNSVWGKMGQRPDKIETQILSVNDPLIGRIITNPAIELTGFKIVDETCFVSSRPEESYLKPAGYTNVAIAAYTTAHARLLLYKAMEKIGDNLCYTDTDSLIYLREKGQPDPVAEMRGEWLGMLTSEIPEGWRMTKFVSPAAKVYSYLLENDNGQVRVVTKAKGVTLDHTAATAVNYDGMERIVRDYVENNSTSVLSAQSTIFKRTLGHIQTADLTKRTGVVMDKLRFLPDYSTLPYGYSL